MRKLWEEFKKFAFKGNVIDMAVGVMIGAAFGGIVTSLVNDIFTPVLALLTGRVDLSSLAVRLGEGENAASIQYGAFFQAVINFLLIAVCVFGFVKLMSRVQTWAEGDKAKAEDKPARLCPYCQMEISDKATRCPHCTSEVPV